MRLEPAAPRSQVKHSTTEPLGSLHTLVEILPARHTQVVRLSSEPVTWEVPIKHNHCFTAMWSKSIEYPANAPNVKDLRWRPLTLHTFRPPDLWWALVIFPWFQNMAHHFPRQWAQWTHPFVAVKKSHFNKKYSSYSDSMNKTKILITNGSWMKVERSILQYIWPALSDNRSWKPILVFFFDRLHKTGYILYHQQSKYICIHVFVSVCR